MAPRFLENLCTPALNYKSICDVNEWKMFTALLFSGSEMWGVKWVILNGLG